MKKYLDAVYGVMRVQESVIAYSTLSRKFEEMTSLKEAYEKSEVDPDDINQLVCPTKKISFSGVDDVHHPPPSPDDDIF